MGNVWEEYHFSSFLIVFWKTVEACLDLPECPPVPNLKYTRTCSDEIIAHFYKRNDRTVSPFVSKFGTHYTE